MNRAYFSTICLMTLGNAIPAFAAGEQGDCSAIRPMIDELCILKKEEISIQAKMIELRKTGLNHPTEAALSELSEKEKLLTISRAEAEKKFEEFVKAKGPIDRCQADIARTVKMIGAELQSEDRKQLENYFNSMTFTTKVTTPSAAPSESL